MSLKAFKIKEGSIQTISGWFKQKPHWNYFISFYCSIKRTLWLYSPFNTTCSIWGCGHLLCIPNPYKLYTLVTGGQRCPASETAVEVLTDVCIKAATELVRQNKQTALWHFLTCLVCDPQPLDLKQKRQFAANSKKKNNGNWHETGVPTWGSGHHQPYDQKKTSPAA